MREPTLRDSLLNPDTERCISKTFPDSMALRTGFETPRPPSRTHSRVQPRTPRSSGLRYEPLRRYAQIRPVHHRLCCVSRPPQSYGVRLPGARQTRSGQHSRCSSSRTGNPSLYRRQRIQDPVPDKICPLRAGAFRIPEDAPVCSGQVGIIVHGDPGVGNWFTKRLSEAGPPGMDIAAAQCRNKNVPEQLRIGKR